MKCQTQKNLLSVTYLILAIKLLQGVHMHPDLMVCAVGSTAEPDGGEEEVSIFVNGVLHYNYLTHRQTE